MLRETSATDGEVSTEEVPGTHELKIIWPSNVRRATISLDHMRTVLDEITIG